MFDGVPIDETDAKADKIAATVAIKTESNPTLPAVDASKQIKESKCDSNSNIMPAKSTTRKRLSNPIASPDNHRNIKSKYKNLSPCTVVLTNLTDKTTTKPNGAGKAATTAVPSISSNSPMPDSSGTSEQPEIIEFSDDDSDADFFEIEESQAPHVPLYHLRDEGAVKWALLSDLCYMLKVKSKDTLLKQVRLLQPHFRCCCAWQICVFPPCHRFAHRCRRPLAATRNFCENWKWETFWNGPHACSCWAQAKNWIFVHRKWFWWSTTTV